jgi:hypothetical protein
MVRRLIAVLVLMVCAIPVGAASRADIDAAFIRSAKDGYMAVPSEYSMCDDAAIATLRVNDENGHRVTVLHNPSPRRRCGPIISLYLVAAFRSTHVAVDVMESLRDGGHPAWLIVMTDRAYVVRQFPWVEDDGGLRRDEPVSAESGE